MHGISTTIYYDAENIDVSMGCQIKHFFIRARIISEYLVLRPLSLLSIPFYWGSFPPSMISLTFLAQIYTFNTSTYDCGNLKWCHYYITIICDIIRQLHGAMQDPAENGAVFFSKRTAIVCLLTLSLFINIKI